MLELLKIFVLGLFLPAVLSGTCTLTENENGGSIYCTKIHQEKYISSIYKFGPNIKDIVKRNGRSRFSVTIRNANLPEIAEWISIPWQLIGLPFNYADLVTSLVIFNSSVRHINVIFGSLKGFRYLQTLDLGGNAIADYSFLKNIEMENLHMGYTNFNLDQTFYNYLSSNPILKLINFTHCNISQFKTWYSSYSNGIEIEIDLSNNLLLNTIDLDYQSNPIRISTLNIDNSYNLRNNLRNPYYKYNRVFNLKMSGFKSNFNFSILTNFSADSLTLRDNDVYRLDKDVFIFKNNFLYSATPSIDLTNTKLNFISKAYFSQYSLRSLILSGNNLTKLTDHTFENSIIEILDISKSRVTYIDSTVFNGLKVSKLNLSKNRLATLKAVFFNISSIKELNLAFNPIKLIDKDTFANCTNLQFLNLTNCYIRRNGISPHSFANLINLNRLELSSTSILDVDRIKNNVLETLVIRNSNLTLLQNYNFKYFYNLKKLEFPGTNIHNISLQALQGLFSIREIDTNNLLSYYGYTPIFNDLPSLQHLNISFSRINELKSSEFRGLTHLVSLNASFNLISKIDINAFRDLEHLNVLSLSHNNLSTLPVGVFSNLRNLTHLYLNYNRITTITEIVSGLEQLIWLDISNNNISPMWTTWQYDNNWLIFPNTLKFLFLQFNEVEYTYMMHNLENFSKLKQIDINHNIGPCEDLNTVLLYFERLDINYAPLNPSYDILNVRGVSCKGHH